MVEDYLFGLFAGNDCWKGCIYLSYCLYYNYIYYYWHTIPSVFFYWILLFLAMIFCTCVIEVFTEDAEEENEYFAQLISRDIMDLAEKHLDHDTFVSEYLEEEENYDQDSVAWEDDEGRSDGIDDTDEDDYLDEPPPEELVWDPQTNEYLYTDDFPEYLYENFVLRGSFFPFWGILLGDEYYNTELYDKHNASDLDNAAGETISQKDKYDMEKRMVDPHPDPTFDDTRRERDDTDLMVNLDLNFIPPDLNSPKFRFNFVPFGKKSIGFSVPLEPSRPIWPNGLYVDDVSELIRVLRKNREEHLKLHPELRPLMVPTFIEATDHRLPLQTTVMFSEPNHFIDLNKVKFENHRVRHGPITRFYTDMYSDVDMPNTLNLISEDEWFVKIFDIMADISVTFSEERRLLHLHFPYTNFGNANLMQDLGIIEDELEDEEIEPGLADDYMDDQFGESGPIRLVHNELSSVYIWPSKVVIETSNNRKALVSVNMRHWFRIPEFVPIWPTKDITIEPPVVSTTRPSELDWPGIISSTDEYAGSTQTGPRRLVPSMPFVQASPIAIGVVRKQPLWPGDLRYPSNNYRHKRNRILRLAFKGRFAWRGTATPLQWIHTRTYTKKLIDHVQSMNYVDAIFFRPEVIRPLVPSVPQNFDTFEDIER